MLWCAPPSCRPHIAGNGVRVLAVQKQILIWAAAAVLCAPLAAEDSNAAIAREIIGLERQVMDGWRAGNPDPALAISDPEITYIHAMTNGRLEGLPALKRLYEQFRGTPLFAGYEIVNPKVQVSGDVAILTYLFVRRNSAGDGERWNATQVYQHKKEGWRVIHAHWSQVKES